MPRSAGMAVRTETMLVGGATAKLKPWQCNESNQTFIPLSETEYRDNSQCGCQDTMTFANFIGCTELISETTELSGFSLGYMRALLKEW